MRDTLFLLAFHLALAYRAERIGYDHAAGYLWSMYREQVRSTHAGYRIVHRAHNIARSLMHLPVNEIYYTLQVAPARTA